MDRIDNLKMVLLGRRNILIFHLGALGDFILTWPLAMALSRLHPQSRVVYVTHGNKGKLAEKVLGIESADIEAGWHHLFGDAAALRATGGLSASADVGTSGGTGSKLPVAHAARLLDNAHSIYSFIAAEGDVWSANVAAIAPEAQLVTLQPRPADDDPFADHVSQWLALQLAKMPTIQTGYTQMLRSVQQRGAGYKRSPEERVIAIHPGSGSAAKCWPIRNFIKLTRKLVKSRHHVRILIGEVEKERISSEDMAHFAAVGEIVEPKNYLELLWQLGVANAVICNDTGPGHLAGIIGVPTIALFGPTDPARWRPLGPHVKTLRAQPMDEITVDQVIAAINE